MPLYAGMPWNELEVLDGVLDRPDVVGHGARAGCAWAGCPSSDVPVYCLEYNRYFDRPYLYGPPGEGYPDNLERFTFLSRGALELCKALGFFPDVIHCNDWQTALVPVYVNTVEWMQPLHAAATVYSIHNLAYQGVFDGGGMFITGLGREHYNPGELEHFGALNLTKGALHHSTLLSTVSPTYAREIQTGEYGCGLDGVLGARSGDLVGILNGIDTDEWNPATDPHLPAPFDADDLAGKAACKAALQKEAGFAVRPDVPLFGVVGRLTSQKGFDVLAHALDAHPGLGRADRAARHRRSGRGALLRLGGRPPRRPLPRLAPLRQRPRPPHRGRRRLLPDAVALRAVRPQPDVQPPLRHAADRARHRRPRRHGRRTTTRRPAAAPASCSTTCTRSRSPTPSAGRSPPGSTAPSTSRPCARRAMAQDFSWARAAAAYHDLYLRAYERRRGHAFG